MDFSGALCKIDASHSWSTVSTWLLVFHCLLSAHSSFTISHAVPTPNPTPRMMREAFLVRSLLAVALSGSLPGHGCQGHLNVNTFTSESWFPAQTFFHLSLSISVKGNTVLLIALAKCLAVIPDSSLLCIPHIQSIRTSVISFFRLFLKAGHSYKIFVPCPRS